MPKDILLYLNAKNPFFYDTIAKEQIIKERELIYKGALDVKLSAKYDDKKFPTTKGIFEQVKLQKSIQNGLEFSVAYRKAQGVQEYNNIKTGKEGEFHSNIKIPVVSLLNNMSTNKIRMSVSKIQSKAQAEKSDMNIRSLYLNVSKLYYQLLLQKELLKTEEELLKKSEQNYKYIVREVQMGREAKVALLDIQSNILDKKQRLLQRKNTFFQTKILFLQYIHLSQKKFDILYSLPQLPKYIQKSISLQKAREMALCNRPEFQDIKYSIKEIMLKKKYNNLAKYPKFDINLYGVYDLQYKEGYKISFDVSVPLQRNVYKGKNQTLTKKLLLQENRRDKIFREIETRIQNILQKILMTQELIILSNRELLLVKELEKIENKKYKQGVSTLVLINHREIKTIQTQQKLLQNYCDLQLLKLSLDYELADDKLSIKESLH